MPSPNEGRDQIPRQSRTQIMLHKFLNSNLKLSPANYFKCMQFNLRHSKAAAANLAQVICENELYVILIQELYATNSNFKLTCHF